MRIYGMKTNHLAEPMGFCLQPLRLSYKVLGEGKKQAAARIRIYDEAAATMYDTGWREDIDSLCYEPDLALTPRTRYLWDVQVRTDAGEEGVSPRAAFETGKMGEGWQGRWITGACDAANLRLTRRFRLAQKPVLRARLYICGLGLYEAYLNGAKVGDEYLTPGCNAYDQWIQVQTYDVTNLLEAESRLTVLLGDGWYKGRFGFRGQKEVYGDTQALLCELRVDYADGTEEVIASDETWQAGDSPVRFANIYDGETYDAAFAGECDMPVRLAEGIGFGRLMDRLSPPVKVMETLRPARVLHTPKGETVLDMGQVMTGWLTFRDQGEAGHEYRLLFGETLQEDCFYNGNLRTAKQRFTYISGGRETWARPHFTFYGFRYVKLEGFGDEVDPYDFVGQVLYSAMDQVGFAKTGQEKVNRLIQNVLWGQKGNFLDVPTDCPQRDERMGWTGDAQAFCATACYQMDGAAFYTKFLHDMEREQMTHEGAVPHVIPSFEMPGSPSCAWADAATIIPWTLYLFYGDKAMLRAQYGNMTRWVAWLRLEDEQTGNHRIWRGGHHFADWLALDAAYPASCTGGTEPEFIASAFYLYSVRLTAKAAAVLGREEDAARYTRLAEEILAAIRGEYFTASGRLAVCTQTACILTLFLGLAPREEEPRVCVMLDRLFEDARMELRTGFVGTAYLCRVLTRYGFQHLAYSLFLREEYPGWLYEVNMGATTVWERWNSILPDGRISDTGMNSLNHYAYGAVMEWLYRDVAAIAPMEDAPGFRRVHMAPMPDPRLGEASFGFESPVGRYESAWQVEDEHTFRWQVTVPFGGQAELALPPCQVEGNAAFRQENGRMRAVVDAGQYAFRCHFEAAPWTLPLMDTPMARLLADPAVGPKLLAAAPHLPEALAGKDAAVNFRKLRSDCFSLLPAWEMEKLQNAMYALAFGYFCE